jgi:hypothetical protein
MNIAKCTVLLIHISGAGRTKAVKYDCCTQQVYNIADISEAGRTKTWKYDCTALLIFQKQVEQKHGR